MQEAAGDLACNRQFVDACPNAGSCVEPHDTPGCEDEPCCNEVCGVDIICCLLARDGWCAQLGVSPCDENACGSGGSCFEAHDAPGCNDPGCCVAVCVLEPTCCQAGGTCPACKRPIRFP